MLLDKHHIVVAHIVNETFDLLCQHLAIEFSHKAVVGIRYILLQRGHLCPGCQNGTPHVHGER